MQYNSQVCKTIRTCAKNMQKHAYIKYVKEKKKEKKKNKYCVDF